MSEKNCDTCKQVSGVVKGACTKFTKDKADQCRSANYEHYEAKGEKVYE